MPNPIMHKYSFPIETKEAEMFFASRHICNRVKAIIAFSRTLPDALRNLRNNLPKDSRHNRSAFRVRAVHAYQHYVNNPGMQNIPFTPMEIPWWECIPREVVPPAKGHWVVWDDIQKWDDDTQWIEFIPDEDPAP